MTPPRADRSRRLAVTAVAVLAAAALLLGSFAGLRWLLGQPTADAPALPTVPPPPTDGGSTLPWVSAMVARDDTTVTVYARAERCEELRRPQATVTRQDASTVTVSVAARVVDASDCATTGEVVPLSVTLEAPFGERTLVDAATQRPSPTYFERHLPDLSSDSRWSPVNGTWHSEDENWYGSYNGPAGSVLDLRAQQGTSAPGDGVVDTVSLGPYQGSIVELANWTVSWVVGEATYTLRLIPGEGGSFTLAEFKQELALLSWS